MADAQEMAGPALAQERDRPVEDTEHVVLGLAQRSADGVAVERQLVDEPGALLTKVPILAALDYAE